MAFLEIADVPDDLLALLIRAAEKHERGVEEQVVADLKRVFQDGGDSRSESINLAAEVYEGTIVNSHIPKK